jgi:hypothetical protein
MSAASKTYLLAYLSADLRELLGKFQNSAISTRQGELSSNNA